MTSSEPPSSPEEKWTAYLDGKLSDRDAAAFEREHPGAASERAANARVMDAVRLHSPASELRNADFFNERILREISPRPSVAAAKPRALWPLWRLAFAGACCLLAVVGTYALFVRGNGGRPREFVRGNEGQPGEYYAQVISATAGDETLDATVLDADGIAVVWIDGLDQLPKDYVLE